MSVDGEEKSFLVVIVIDGIPTTGFCITICICKLSLPGKPLYGSALNTIGTKLFRFPDYQRHLLLTSQT